jgi:serine protease Do
VEIQDLNPQLAKGLGVPVQKGAIVADVQSGTPGARAGLKANDVIVSIDGTEVTGAKSLTRSIGFAAPGKESALGVYRGAKKLDLKVKLGTRPDLEGLTSKGEDDSAATEQPADKLGIKVEDGEAAGAGAGAYLVFVEPGSPAEKADLRANMLVDQVNGQKIGSAQELLRALHAAKPGSTLLLRVALKNGHLLRALTVP